jgi:hypothetical protein
MNSCSSLELCSVLHSLLWCLLLLTFISATFYWNKCSLECLKVHQCRAIDSRYFPYKKHHFMCNYTTLVVYCFSPFYKWILYCCAKTQKIMNESVWHLEHFNAGEMWQLATICHYENWVNSLHVNVNNIKKTHNFLLHISSHFVLFAKLWE